MRTVVLGASLLLGSACVLSHAAAEAQTRPPPASREAKTVVAAGTGSAQPVAPVDRITLIADRDDDDADDRPDAEAELVTPGARVDVVTLDARYAGATLTARDGRRERAHPRAGAAARLG